MFSMLDPFCKHLIDTRTVFATWLCVGMMFASAAVAGAEEAASLELQLKGADVSRLAVEARRRGDPHRGAIVFHTSTAGCVNCHQAGENTSPLGPDLATLASNPETPVTDQYLIESLLYPSKSIRKGFETVRLLTDSGEVFSGMLVRETDDAIVLRDATSLEKEITVKKNEIDVRSAATQSMMPDGLIATFGSQRDFYDLASYVFAVVEGGRERAAALRPTPDQLIVLDDTGDLDHAGILKKIARDKKSLASGEATYNGLCASCHGVDGNTPSLATARAFGTQKLKFGADPYRMFMTLSVGNGMMAATTYLSPRERYDVVNYIRQRFMKGHNPEYKEVTAAYLAGLPKGTKNGDFEPDGPRDYGPALASQLGTDVNSALTIKLGSMTASYDLHTLDQAGLWRGGFLDLNQTQHYRGRGEGYPKPDGRSLPGLAGWRWGHEGTLDYPKDNLPPRGPLPSKWLDYRGHHIHGDQVVLSYRIDRRDVLELPEQIGDSNAIRRHLKIGAGRDLVVATGVGQNTMSEVFGDIQGVTLSMDDQDRWVMRIPADDKPRLLNVVTVTGDDPTAREILSTVQSAGVDPSERIHGGPANWEPSLSTVGYLGLEPTPYVLDTISIPDSTPWNNWLRTTAIDFFDDGRMAVTTHGGDVWIVSGIDDDLLDVKWKRFAGGLFEPFGVKVVDETIYVTSRDRLTRLHDQNNDGEADFYESFFTDPDVSTFFHSFNFDLHTDSEGNFYYAKCGQYTSYALPGSVMKVSPDGKEYSIFCTGFRTPNGMGMLPQDQITVSDNQGNWMPASKISLVREGGFYGYVQNKTGGKNWAPDGGRIDPKKVIPPTSFDQPIVWMPQDVDNSSGGQIWVDDPRFGPLSGHLLHTSFGKGWLFYLMTQEVGKTAQAAIVKLPFNFSTGIMRGRVNPIDGQVYVTGLNGWNENGRSGLRENGIERIRYTGKPLRMLLDCRVVEDGLELFFNFPLDASTATDASLFTAEQWNYHWTEKYGSEFYNPETDQVGKQRIVIKAVALSDENRSIKLTIPKIRPVNQMHLQMSLTDQSGEPFSQDVYWTINEVPHQH